MNSAASIIREATPAHVRMASTSTTIISHAQVKIINNYSTKAPTLTIYHLISNKCEWNNCFIKTDQEILLDLTDFGLQEQPEDIFTVAISRLIYHGLSQSNSWNCIIR